MTDYFALLDEPRRPWIDPKALKAKFIALSAEVHPDRMHNRLQAEREATNQRFAQLSAAYNCLSEAKERLAHLLELERGDKPKEVQRISGSTVDWFVEVSQACGEADAFLTERTRTISPLLRVQLLEKGWHLTDKLKGLEARLKTVLDQLVVQLKNLNMAWESAPAVGSPTRINVLPCNRLEQIYRDVSYLTRWTQQIHERIVQLSL